MPTSLAQKLQLKPGSRLALLNAPAGRLERIAAELPGIHVALEATDPSGAVRLVALDDVWSVMRFQPADQVKSAAGS